MVQKGVGIPSVLLLVVVKFNLVTWPLCDVELEAWHLDLENLFFFF